MGFNIQSSDTTQTIQDFTDVVNSAVENSYNEADLTCSANNGFELFLGSTPPFNNNPPANCETNIKNGEINVNQVAQVNCSLNADFTTTFQNNLTTNVKSEVEQWINNNFNSNQGWLAFAFSAQIAQNETRASIATKISNGLVANITNKCAAQLSASNNGIISICGNYNNETFNFDQAALTTNITSCIANTTVSFVASDTVLNTMSQTADTKLANTQQGIGSLFAWLKWIILAAVILAVVIIIGVVLYLIFGGHGGKKGPDEQAQKKQILESALERKRSFERHHANINEALNRSRY